MQKLILGTLCFLFSISAWAQDLSRLSDLLTNHRYRESLALIDSLPPSRELPIKKVACLKALQEYRAATSELEMLAEKYPDDTHIKTELATCYEALDKPNASLQCYNQLIEMDSTNLFFRIKKADLLYRLEHYQPALEMYLTLYQQDSAEVAIKRIAQSFEKINELDSAVVYFGLALEKDSTDIHAAANLVNLHIRTKEFGEAIMLSDLLVQRDSTNKTINVLNGLSYYGKENYGEAAKRFQRCYDNNDTSLVVNRSLGFCYYSLFKSKEAIPYLQNAFRQDTTSTSVLFYLGQCYNDADQYEEAIECFNKLIEMTLPKKYELYLYYVNAARNYQKNIQYKLAAQNFLSALEVARERDKRVLYYELAQLYRNLLNDTANALVYYGLYRKDIEKELATYKNKKEKTQEDYDAISKIERSLDILDTNISKIKKPSITKQDASRNDTAKVN